MAKDKEKTSEENKAAEEAAAKLAEEAAAKALEGQGSDKPAAPSAPSPAPRSVGDVPVVCLKTEVNCRLGNRNYQLQKGNEIMMDPSHASELEGTWVRQIT
jgi:hypothetical protein